MHLHPLLNEGIFYFVPLPATSSSPPEAIGTFREQEGTTLILEKEKMNKHGYIYQDYPAFARITLSAETDLLAVGITAAVSKVLAENGISCNVIAAFHHDHLFVPRDQKEQALTLLKDILI